MNLRSEKVIVERRNGVGIITISDPQTRNAMTLDMVEDLVAVVTEFNADAQIRCAVVMGAGEKAFTSGGNLRDEVRYATEEKKMIDVFNRTGMQLIRSILWGRIPFLAAVQGYALGAALALIAACDIVYASDDAVFGLPTPSLGGIPGWGCTQLIPRIIGRHAAQKMLLLNEKIDAEEAFRLRLVSEICPAGEVNAHALHAAEQIASYAPETMCAIKRAVYCGADLPLETALELEGQMLYRVNTQDNFSEGIQAFLEKRTPNFNGKR